MTSTTRQYFEAAYARGDDPWELASSDYERRKYSITVASLPRARYANAFEPGCSVGVLSERLADRCDRLLVTDIIDAALVQTAHRLKSHRHVRVQRCAIPTDWPDETFDLVVLSEVAYYFDAGALADIMTLVVETTSPGSHVVGVHWRGETDYPISGDRAHELIGLTPELSRLVHHVEREFMLDVWERLE
jgi:hypothetical protein